MLTVNFTRENNLRKEVLSAIADNTLCMMVMGKMLVLDRNSNNIDVVIGEHNFVGCNPTFVTEEARFFCKNEFYSTRGNLSLRETSWTEEEESQADYYSMVLDHGEWSFYPEWEKMKIKDERQFEYEEYSDCRTGTLYDPSKRNIEVDYNLEAVRTADYKASVEGRRSLRNLSRERNGGNSRIEKRDTIKVSQLWEENVGLSELHLSCLTKGSRKLLDRIAKINGFKGSRSSKRARALALAA